MLKANHLIQTQCNRLKEQNKQNPSAKIKRTQQREKKESNIFQKSMARKR